MYGFFPRGSGDDPINNDILEATKKLFYITDHNNIVL